MGNINKIIMSAIIYIVVTSFFAYLLINEKKLGEKMKIYRDKFSDIIILDKKLVLKTDIAKFLYPIHLLFIIGAGVITFYFLMLTPDSNERVKYVRALIMNRINMMFLVFTVATIVMYILYNMKKADFEIVRKLGPINFIATLAVGIYNHMAVENLPAFSLMDLFLLINLIFMFIYIFSDELSIRKLIDYKEMIISAVVLVLLLQHFYIGNFLVPTGSMIPTINPGDRLLGDMVSYKFIKPSRGDIIVFKEPIEDKVLYTKRLIGYPGEKVKVDENGNIFINNKIVKNKKINAKYVRKGFMADKEWIIPKKGDTIEVIGGHAVLQNDAVQDIDIASFQQMMEVNDKEVTDAIPYARFLLNGKDETGPILDFKYDKELADKLFKGEKIVLDKDYYFVLGDNSNNSYDSRFWGFVAEDRIKGRPFMRFWPLNKIGILK